MTGCFEATHNYLYSHGAGCPMTLIIVCQTRAELVLRCDSLASVPDKKDLYAAVESQKNGMKPRGRRASDRDYAHRDMVPSDEDFE